MNSPSAALIEQPELWTTAVPTLAAVPVAVSVAEVPATESDSGEWGRPGIIFGSDGDGASERNEVGTALAESYAEAFARRRQNDAELVH